MKNFKNIICAVMAFMMVFSVIVAVPTTSYAAENTQSDVILSATSLTLSENETTTFTAALPIGYDGTRLSYVVADTSIATVAPIAYASNVAAFAISYVGDGSTVIAIYNIDNPLMVSYITVNTSKLIMDIPEKLGTNKDNYFTLTSYEIVPYDFTYQDFNDYKYTLNITYTCASFKDDEFTKWGCYGYFYDAQGNILKKVHLYASSLAKGRTFHSEFNVPVNAVKFSIEGFK